MRGSETPAAGGADDGVTRRIHALLDPAQTPGFASRFLGESSLLVTPFGQGEKPSDFDEKYIIELSPRHENRVCSLPYATDRRVQTDR